MRRTTLRQLHPNTPHTLVRPERLVAAIEGVARMKATLQLCGGASWEIAIDGQQVDVEEQCTAHEDCWRVRLQNGRNGYFHKSELIEVTA
jgi:hypothetical protein